ncbi:hypothetical protein KM043_006807 [Ampulex compressa]|nr:hypothetical protein KM043_006807 [Ampulex compressa]
MSYVPNPEILTEAAGVKIIMTPLPEEDYPAADTCTAGRIELYLETGGTELHDGMCGFHLSKSKWDPYPWVGYVENGSLADLAGLRAGDCLTNVDGQDLLGLRIKEVASIIQNQHRETGIKLSVWRYPAERNEKKEIAAALDGPLPEVTRKLAEAVSSTVRVLECPICLESATPPVSQCVQGHILCVDCRPRATRCPVCRVRLGQGRCLLADKLHRIFVDAFGVKNEHRSSNCESFSLRERLFGKAMKKGKGLLSAKSNSETSKPRQLSLARLLLGGIGKATSADNLTSVTGQTESRDGSVDADTNLKDRLHLQDRTKSASTGELANGSERRTYSSSLRDNGNINEGRLTCNSTPQTPTWGGSMDSVTCVQLACPLSRQIECKEVITSGTLLEHLNRAHEVPQVHFYSGSVNIPIPLPFGQHAIYMLHYSGEIFFFQCEEESVWVACTIGGSNTWDWILHGWGADGTEVKLHRNVASLEEPLTLTAQHIAPLPKVLFLHTINIQLLQYRSCDRLNI